MTQTIEQPAAPLLATTDTRTALWIDPELTRRVLTQFIGEEIGKFGLRRGVVGVSGGIDSALVVALAAQALGPENVLAVLMPYRLSSPESFEHGFLCVQQLGVQHRKIPITAQVDPYFEQFPDMPNRR